MSRVYLMADFGEGPRATGKIVRIRNGHVEVADRWWLVEADSADNARAIITNDRGTIAAPGRILDQGDKP